MLLCRGQLRLARVVVQPAPSDPAPLIREAGSENVSRAIVRAFVPADIGAAVRVVGRVHSCAVCAVVVVAIAIIIVGVGQEKPGPWEEPVVAVAVIVVAIRAERTAVSEAAEIMPISTEVRGSEAAAVHYERNSAAEVVAVTAEVVASEATAAAVAAAAAMGQGR